MISLDYTGNLIPFGIHALLIRRIVSSLSGQSRPLIRIGAYRRPAEKTGAGPDRRSRSRMASSPSEQCSKSGTDGGPHDRPDRGILRRRRARGTSELLGRPLATGRILGLE